MPESKEVVDRIQDPVAENFLLASCEVRPLYWLLRRLFLRNNAGNEPISFTKFHRFPCTQPGFEPPRIAKLANVNGWHDVNVAQHVTQRQVFLRADRR